jgi:rhodanese-related sulfurtransferase
MMKNLAIKLVLVLAIAVTPAFAANVGKISPDELKGLLGADNLIILDVRTGKDWKSSEFKIPGAIRANPSEFATWGNSYPKEKKIVLYCA